MNFQKYKIRNLLLCTYPLKFDSNAKSPYQNTRNPTNPTVHSNPRKGKFAVERNLRQVGGHPFVTEMPQNQTHHEFSSIEFGNDHRNIPYSKFQLQLKIKKTNENLKILNSHQVTFTQLLQNNFAFREIPIRDLKEESRRTEVSSRWIAWMDKTDEIKHETVSD